MRRTAAVIAVTIAASSIASPASAYDRWTRPYPGVAHLHRTASGFDFHVVTVDLQNPRVQFVTTDESMTRPAPDAERPGYRWTRTSTFARETGAEIAINANYYDIFHRKHSACGFTMTAGKPWHSTYNDGRLDCYDSIGFGVQGRAEVFDSRGLLEGPAPQSWMMDVVTGSPRLLRDGEIVQYTFPHHALSRNPRTALGLSEDRHTLFIMVVNGREGRSQGMTCPEAARSLRSLGAWNAVNLDGGGSSALYVRREHGIVSYLADGAERPVGNHFGIVFRDPPPPVIEEAPPAPHVERAVASLTPAVEVSGARVLATATATGVAPNWRSIIAAIASSGAAALIAGSNRGRGRGRAPRSDRRATAVPVPVPVERRSPIARNRRRVPA